MTKQHFIALADHIKASFEPYTRRQLEALADFCAAQNPRFNRELWLDYIDGRCGPNGGKR